MDDVTGTPLDTGQSAPVLDESARSARPRPVAILLLALVLTLLAYIATVRFAFVYDDRLQIVANPILHSWRYFPSYFTTHIWQNGHPEASANYYRPLPMTWKLIHYTTIGLNPFWWHVSSILVHLGVTVLVFTMARRLTGDSFVAGASAILFGLHPAHIEDVAWVSGVTDPLLTLLLIASFLCYIGIRRPAGAGRSKLGACVSVLLYGMATLTKVTALTFPALLFFFEYIAGSSGAWPYTDERSGLKRCQSALKRTVPYLIVSGIYLAVRLEVLKGFSHVATPVPASTIILTSPSILWFYAKSLIYPVGLSPFYDVPLVTKPGVPNFVVPLFCLGVAALLVLRLAKGSKLVLFLAAWMILPMLPVLNVSVFTSGDITHDRFLYLPSAGFSILVAASLRRLSWRGLTLFGEPGAQVLTVCAAACILGILTINQEQFWQDDLTLYSRGVWSAPKNRGAANNLAVTLVERGLSSEALDLLRLTQAREPNYWIFSYNLGLLCYKLGNDEEAEKYLRQAVDLNPQSSRANFFLGMVSLNAGRLDAAESSIKRAIEIGPTQDGFYYGLGLVLEKKGKILEALEAYGQELALSPDQAEVVARRKALKDRSATLTR